MLKPQIFEHPHFLLHHEARLKSELQTLLRTHLGQVCLGVAAAWERIVADDGNDDFRTRHFLWFFVIISILIFPHTCPHKHPTATSTTTPQVLSIFLMSPIVLYEWHMETS